MASFFFFLDVSMHVTNTVGSGNEMSKEIQLAYKLGVYFL